MNNKPAAHRLMKSKIQTNHGFTLVELLTVIAVIGVLAAMLLAVTGGVQKVKYINTTRGEMSKIETALDNYKATYGVYPPSGTNVFINPLFCELIGMTNNNPTANTANASFSSLDGLIAVINPMEAYNISGFVNCNKPGGGGEDAPQAKDFLLDLRPRQWDVYTNNSAITNAILIASVGGPDAGYTPIGIQGINPWRYAYPGTNNPNSYDLWVQLVINKQTYLICNWSSKAQINTPYP